MGLIIKYSTQIGLLAIVLAILVVLGNVINLLIGSNWSYLTYFFVIIRETTGLFGFMIDLPTLFTLFGLSLAVQVGVWGYRATATVVNYFNMK